jgi:acyl-CoA thioester hydrolase
MTQILKAEKELEIPFHDVDAMQIVWHGNYYKYFEIARTALFRAIRYDVDEMLKSNYGWPVVETHCRYLRPLVYGMKIRVVATLMEYEHRVKIGYEIFENTTGGKMCKGYTTQVAYDMEKKETCLVVPHVLLEKLGIV